MDKVAEDSPPGAGEFTPPAATIQGGGGSVGFMFFIPAIRSA
jgi:hypothetical protein